MNKLGFYLLLIFFYANTSLFAQARSAQEVLAKADSILNPGKGLMKGTLTLIKRSGDSVVWKVNIFRNKQDSLHLFEKGARGLEAKLLFKDEGDKTYFFNALSQKLFQKNEDEKYEPHLTTGFSFVDLSGYSYQVNYNPVMQGTVDIAGKTYLRVSMKPILPLSYKKLVLLVEPSSLKPFRIDFHDKDGVLFKTLNFKYTKLKIKENQVKNETEFPARMEMLDLNTGSISVLEYLEIDRDVSVDKSLFEVANLNK